ncbi:hypothetical protein NEICINOT_05170 [Neisseria cinerea ATCC 14685]|uniref:Uncharacterized protein n=1 Tax=Neisseria cinerea ATCC 14685 TaxID=546262 RepID=D0W643_NEICI|nr:hypothetical protein NEICINOT_05170 [Neisseria cinerea ATCC 14685]
MIRSFMPSENAHRFNIRYRCRYAFSFENTLPLPDDKFVQFAATVGNT